MYQLVFKVRHLDIFNGSLMYSLKTLLDLCQAEFSSTPKTINSNMAPGQHHDFHHLLWGNRMLDGMADLLGGSRAVVDKHKGGEDIGGQADDGDEVGCDP